MRTAIRIAMFLFATALFLPPELPAAEKQPGASPSPLAVLTGDNSHVEKPAYQLVLRPDEWTKVWLAHLGQRLDTIHRPAFEIDFKRCMVVAVFRGVSENSRGFRVASVLEGEDAVIVQFESISFQTDVSLQEARKTGGGGERVTPYAFIVLPKSEKPVALELNVQQYIGHPPEWKEVARLADNKDAAHRRTSR